MTTYYQGVLVGSGSDLEEALEKKDQKLAKKVFNETTQIYARLYPKEDREWFAAASLRYRGGPAKTDPDN